MFFGKLNQNKPTGVITRALWPICYMPCYRLEHLKASDGLEKLVRAGDFAFYCASYVNGKNDRCRTNIGCRAAESGQRIVGAWFQTILSSGERVLRNLDCTMGRPI